MKIPRRDQLTPEETEQFLREARFVPQLAHPNNVGVHEVGRQDGDGAGGTDTQAISFTNTDENDNVPTVPSGQIFSVSESDTNGTSLGTVTTTDANSMGSLQNWQITRGNTDGIFVINSFTRKITIADNTNTGPDARRQLVVEGERLGDEPFG